MIKSHFSEYIFLQPFVTTGPTPLKLNFWVSDIITPFGIHVCTTVTTQGSPLKLNETEIKEVKDMADSQSTAMRR